MIQEENWLVSEDLAGLQVLVCVAAECAYTHCCPSHTHTWLSDDLYRALVHLLRLLLLLLLQVLARHVNPEQMLEVVHLNEVLAEAQRGAAAADAAVAAVDKVG
jgi:hypothetical protein